MLLRQQKLQALNQGSGSLVQQTLNSAPFTTQFERATLVLARGSGNPTFTRATTKTMQDWERLITIPAGVPAMVGARFVQNLFSSTEYFGNAYWDYAVSSPVVTVDQGVAPNGTNTADRLQLPAGARFGKGAMAIVIGHTYCFTSYIKAYGAGTQTGFLWAFATSVNVQNTFNVDTTWKRIEVTFTAQATENANLSWRSTGGADLLIWGAQFEDVTGQSNQNPSEYVSVGVLSAPFHGAGPDGCKFFPYLNGNTVNANVVTEAQGAPLSGIGYYPESAATQLIAATADIRDMTTASWTKGATLTRARDAVGMDGIANTANTLTGGAVSATNIITYALTAAASSRTYSVGLKRGVGTGQVLLTQDNFATTTDITSQLNTSTFTVVSCTQSQLNAVFGIKVVTNGDTVIADCNQFEAGSVATSRILTGGATRNEDVLTYQTAGNISGTIGTIYAKGASFANYASWVPTLVGNSVTDRAMVYIANPKSHFYDGVNDVTGPNAGVSGATAKYCNAWGSSTVSLAVNGATVVSGAFDGDINLDANFAIGRNGFYTVRSWNGPIYEICAWPDRKSDALLQALTV